MKAHELLSDRRRFKLGSLATDAKGQSCGTLRDSGAVAFDALGAIFWCYPNGLHNKPDNNGFTPCQKARELVRSKYDCTLGRLEWEEALDVLKSVDV